MAEGLSRLRASHPVVEHRPDALRIDAHDLGHPFDRHLPFDQGHRQGFEEQGEAAVRSRPGHSHRLNPTIAGIDLGLRFPS